MTREAMALALGEAEPAAGTRTLMRSVKEPGEAQS